LCGTPFLVKLKSVVPKLGLATFKLLESYLNISVIIGVRRRTAASIGP
jgi:hypothetical protein